MDPPESDWATCWKENNTGKSWDDFLMAVKHRFDPPPYEGSMSMGMCNKTRIKPSDSPAFQLDRRGWGLPPSLTQPPTGVSPLSFPRHRCDPPRFDGENATEWIRNIQMYYNHYYTPLSDRLYLTTYLFDQPASDWMVYWTDINAGKGWDDFLLAVKLRFDPDPYENYVERLATLRQTSSVGVVSDECVDLSITSVQQTSLCGMGELKDENARIAEWSRIYQKATPVRKPHIPTSNLATLSEAPSPAVPSAATPTWANQLAD